jgi:hypothetical protein
MTPVSDRIFGANGEYKENRDLKIVHIPATYTAIAEEAFECSSIEELSIPSSVTEIGTGAFACAEIKRLMLPDWEYWCAINLLGEWPNPLVLSERVFIGGEEISTSIEIPDTVRELKPGVLCGLKTVEHIHLPNTISKIGESAFGDCQSLKEINIPESVTEIGEKAFAWCASLKTVVIPRSVHYISRWAFYACDNLRTVISLNPCPPDCEYAFEYGKDLTLYVPAGSVEAYANAEGWSKFKEIKEVDPNETLNNY